MKNIEFQKILLQTVVLSMSANGFIQEEELKKINKIADNHNYYSELNYKSEAINLLESIKKRL